MESRLRVGQCSIVRWVRVVGRELMMRDIEVSWIRPDRWRFLRFGGQE